MTRGCGGGWGHPWILGALRTEGVRKEQRVPHRCGGNSGFWGYPEQLQEAQGTRSGLRGRHGGTWGHLRAPSGPSDGGWGGGGPGDPTLRGGGGKGRGGTHRCSSSSSMRCPSQTKTPARVAMRRPAAAARAGRPRNGPPRHHHHSPHPPPPPPPPPPRRAPSAPLPPPPSCQALRALRARCPLTQPHCRASRPSRPRRPASPPLGEADGGGRGPRREARAQRASRPSSGRRGCNMPPLCAGRVAPLCASSRSDAPPIGCRGLRHAHWAS